MFEIEQMYGALIVQSKKELDKAKEEKDIDDDSLIEIDPLKFLATR